MESAWQESRIGRIARGGAENPGAGEWQAICKFKIWG
jgi:hypothetical protein